MYQLESPLYFYLLLLIPLMVLLFVGLIIWKLKKQKLFANQDVLNHLAPNQSFFKAILKFCLLIVVIVGIIIALVNPKIGSKLETVKREGIDIVFALDVSKSMLAEDIAPSRLQKSKQIISTVIDNLASDRVGIIIYAGNSYPLLPITTDHSSAKMFLQTASPSMVSSQGTAIGHAIERANSFFNKEEQTNKYLIIISDGEDHLENIESVLKETQSNGINVIAVGVGTTEGGPIPIKMNSRIVGYKKDGDNKIVQTVLNDKVLRDIAASVDGEYYNGNVTKSVVESIDEVLKKANRTEFEAKKFADYKDQFQWGIGFALLFLLLDTFMLNRKTSWIQKLNLFNTSKDK